MSLTTTAGIGSDGRVIKPLMFGVLLGLLATACRGKRGEPSEAGHETGHSSVGRTAGVAETGDVAGEEPEDAVTGAKIREREPAKRVVVPVPVDGKPGFILGLSGEGEIDVRGKLAGDWVDDPDHPGDDARRIRLPEDWMPVAMVLEGRSGFVLSPFNGKLIDVRDIPPGTLVMDPTFPPDERKYFRVPAEDSGMAE